jgi:hypothetical protein
LIYPLIKGARSGHSAVLSEGNIWLSCNWSIICLLNIGIFSFCFSWWIFREVNNLFHEMCDSKAINMDDLSKSKTAFVFG